MKLTVTKEQEGFSTTITVSTAWYDRIIITQTTPLGSMKLLPADITIERNGNVNSPSRLEHLGKALIKASKIVALLNERKSPLDDVHLRRM